MKKVWLSRKFTYIFDAIPSTNRAFYMQSLYAHTISYMVGTGSLSKRLGALYCLYCLYETQPFKPPFKIYLSLGELKKIKALVVDAKEKSIKVVPTLVNRMLEKNVFLFGSVDLNAGSFSQTVNQLTELQNARVQLAYKKLFANTRIEQFLDMDMGAELDYNTLKKMSTEYAEAKKQAIQEASKVVDIQNIQHISNDKELIGDAVENITGNWNVQKEAFYQQTGLNQHTTLVERQQLENQGKQEDDEFGHHLELQLVEDESHQQKQEDDEFSSQLELQLVEDGPQQKQEDDEFDQLEMELFGDE